MFSPAGESDRDYTQPRSPGASFTTIWLNSDLVNGQKVEDRNLEGDKEAANCRYLAREKTGYLKVGVVKREQMSDRLGITSVQGIETYEESAPLCFSTLYP